jgi:dienelactone hydrolase
MHDCSGLGPRSSGAPARWGKELVSRGYVAIVPDSFATRGFPNGVCVDPAPARSDVSPNRRARDAYAALAYARTLPFVDGRRVGLMGGSHGGSTTLAAMRAPASDSEPLARDKRTGFSAAVALYPGCTAQLEARPRAAPGAYRPTAPLLILIGEKDDWTPAEPCRKLADASQAAGYPVRIKIYPGAHHSFDSDRPVRYVQARVNPTSPTERGATTGGNQEAWDDSIREVAAFFREHL